MAKSTKKKIETEKAQAYLLVKSFVEKALGHGLLTEEEDVSEMQRAVEVLGEDLDASDSE